MSLKLVNTALSVSARPGKLHEQKAESAAYNLSLYYSHVAGLGQLHQAIKIKWQIDRNEEKKRRRRVRLGSDATGTWWAAKARVAVWLCMCQPWGRKSSHPSPSNESLPEKKANKTNGGQKLDNIFTIQLSNHGNDLMMAKCVTDEQLSPLFSSD